MILTKFEIKEIKSLSEMIGETFEQLQREYLMAKFKGIDIKIFILNKFEIDKYNNENELQKLELTKDNKPGL